MGFSFDGVTSKSMGIASRMATENRVPELKNRTISMAGRDGLIDLGASLSERVIEISCFIPPKRTAAELLECKDEIVSWLSPDKGVCALMLDTEPGRVYYARLQEGVTFERVVRLAATFDLAFFCPERVYGKIAGNAGNPCRKLAEVVVTPLAYRRYCLDKSFLKNIIALLKGSVSMYIIHGYNHGCAIKEMLRNTRLSSRNYQVLHVDWNPGMTKLVTA